MEQPTEIAGPAAVKAADDGNSSGILHLDAQLCIVSLDEAAGTLLGAAPQALLGRRLDEIADLADLGAYMKSGTVFNGQPIEVSGRRILCDYLPTVESDQVVGGVLSLLRVLPDALDCHVDLKELLQSAGAYLDLNYDGIVICDRAGIIVMVNQAFADLLDTTPHAIIGKHLNEAYLNSQPSRLPGVMETETPQVGITHYINGKQVYASLYPIQKDGKVVGGIGKILFKDIREITLIANRLQTAPETRALAGSVTRKETSSRYDVNSIVGQSKKILDLKESLLRVAGKNSNVLLLGESGTGKELFAHAIHAASNRRYAQFVKVNCAAIPEHLLESELFGYSEGAFTGARKGGQLGKFEQAHLGTIFLDEIGDMPLYMQAKMLRVLQERELTPLGGGAPKMVDVRVVAATNCNLEHLVREGKFRQDLYYRLKVVTLAIPSLRERREDIRPLVMSFIHQFNEEFGLEVQALSLEAREVIMRYDWPGNVRELRNVIESAFNLVTGPLILRDHLPEQLSRMHDSSAAEASAAQDIGGYIHQRLGAKPLSEIVDEFEQLLLETALEVSKGNKLQAADLLGISRQWLYKKLHKYESGEDP
ncbi:sigma 54-interacting transcriptional regulator [Geomonas subterranea]|uniref:Sigma 54-interacting transcriptional regulator n=1 Tax=Geomonas subterranea TaxID=2847989 RepID=A0ABX8LP63_9BACT|nr:sigma 54-interacting transcriptional regulator [Geomonas subterranea]QXE91320.1 sigma 54-interacting transcriptional regulator [Geomonas subterranea]QXM10593.1 sigma 54-interacting transcriptional regulator [Geomonas subterranea]